MTDKIERFAAIDQGKKAFHNGVEFESNPHLIGDIEQYGWWQLGWLKAYWITTERERREGE